MLETLNSVPWDTLEHAYGKASNVPDLIRALASPVQHVCDDTLEQLWFNVIHQGTVYSSTAFVVPFFCELVKAPDVLNRDQLLYYLATIARGASYADVHVKEAARRETPEMQKQITEELGWVQAASNAVSDGYPTYIWLLHDPDPTIRESAAHTLSRCQSHAEQVIPIMKEHLTREKDSSVQASLILSLGMLSRNDEEAVLFFHNTLQEETDPLLQIATAISSTFCLREQTSQEALKVLIQSYELPLAVKQRFGRLSFANVNLGAYVSSALRRIGLSIAPLVTPILIHNVRHSDTWNGQTLVNNLLFFALEGKKITHTMTVTDLSDLQKDALTAIYETEDLWEWGMSFTVGNFFDPRFNPSPPSVWGREYVGAFLAGQKVFNY
ncbi:hypothetical protein KDA_35740 [Dictyobacter alpinus]|uniref:HEAT repeat domain-containing protein n=1 Tax=Dictyobacter alpinus TaxID=2014873 RepID=A0A402B9V9_9CHLR|nr:HEAT repeat domain-containing protein [Dictyobacter alpinus]GCE28090.1 hypothetical protein KDA_35740 [Dictyobacter alpinus]